MLVNLATPEIMLDKIIGAPDLYRRIVEDNYWGEDWRAGLAAWPRGLVGAAERVVRYVALYAVFAIPLVVALLAVPRHERRARIIVTVLCLLPFWLLAKVVVLDWAITDNITELVADGGTVFLAALVALLARQCGAAGWLAPRRANGAAAGGGDGSAAVCAGWWLLNQGIETVVINNGRIFNGVQFLLGENRSALLSAPALFARWCALDAAALAVVVAGVLLVKRAGADSRASRQSRAAHAKRAALFGAVVPFAGRDQLVFQARQRESQGVGLLGIGQRLGVILLLEVGQAEVVVDGGVLRLHRGSVLECREGLVRLAQRVQVVAELGSHAAVVRA